MPAPVPVTVRQDYADFIGGPELYHPPCRPNGHFTPRFGCPAYPRREMGNRHGCARPHTEVYEPRCRITSNLEVLARE